MGKGGGSSSSSSSSSSRKSIAREVKCFWERPLDFHH